MLLKTAASLATLVSFALTRAACASAQTVTVVADPETVVLARIRSEIGPGRIALDPRPLKGHELGARRSAIRSLALAQAVNADTARVDKLVKCTSDRASSCSLSGYAATIVMSAPRFSSDGQSAFVEVKTKRSQKLERIPISTESRIFTLMKSGERWTVRSVRYASRS